MHKLYLYLFLIITLLIGFVILSSRNTAINSIENVSSCSSPEELNHIYNPTQLEILDICKSISGIVKNVTILSDGNALISVHEDNAYQSMLSTGNKTFAQGYFILEIICAYAPTQTTPKKFCNNYVNKVYIPHVGEHVIATGRFVANLAHGQWNEFNPAYDISVN